MKKGETIDIEALALVTNGYYYNIIKLDDSRTILFLGKSGSMVRKNNEEIIYVSGYTGNKYNTRIAVFHISFDNQFEFRKDLHATTHEQVTYFNHLAR